MAGTYDAIIIGGGHNGLVAACYLARAKRKVLVLERRYVVGGACVTEETFPGFKVSTAAYVNSLFRPEIIRELRLADYGFASVERNPSSFSPFMDGRHLFLGPDSRMNLNEISKFSERDAENYPQYEKMLARVAAVIEPTLTMTPPNVMRPGLGGSWKLLKLARSFQRLGPAMAEAVEILTGPARPMLDRWFEAEKLKATLATDAIIGAFAAPSMPGTAYVLFHHVMGETNGKRGVWSYVERRHGRPDRRLAKAAKDLGVEIRTEAEVAEDSRPGRRGQGRGPGQWRRIQRAESGQQPRSAHDVQSACSIPKLLPPDYREAVGRIDYDSASLKINVALSELPNFTALPGTQAGPQHRGTMHLCPDQDFIERAYDDAKYGRPSKEPILECTIPSSVDPTVAPPGKHLMSMFIQYAPYKLKEGTWDEHRRKTSPTAASICSISTPRISRSRSSPARC